MQNYFIDKKITYDGTQLRSHWIYDKTGILEDAIVGFAGKADVNLKHMVDLEDVKAKEHIFSPLMLHFISEHFRTDIKLAVCFQRILCSIITNTLKDQTKKLSIKQKGDDIFDIDKKVSVSIATVSPISALIHFGINIQTKNTPVPTNGLDDYKIEYKIFAKKIMELYTKEIKSINRACCKVRAVL